MNTHTHTHVFDPFSFQSIMKISKHIHLFCNLFDKEKKRKFTNLILKFYSTGRVRLSADCNSPVKLACCKRTRP
jgi:hypothetical protein